MMLPFYYGALSFGCCVVALFFTRFYVSTRDRLFLLFALAFLAFAVNWCWLTVARPPNESRHLIYLVRLLAFGLILVGILDKNRRA